MKKMNLLNVTLVGIDCVNVERLQKALDISCEHIEFGSVKLLTSLDTEDIRKIEIPHINSMEEYSKFCLRDLDKYIDTEYVLIVQHDGFVLNSSAWDEEFLKYDYIGAVWLVGDWGGDDFPKEFYGREIVGNGGFSLRSKKLLSTSANLFQTGKIINFSREDVAICVWHRDLFEEKNIIYAPVSVAKKFSCNIKDKNSYWSNEFGFHGLKANTIIRLSKWIEENSRWDIGSYVNK